MRQQANSVLGRTISTSPVWVWSLPTALLGTGLLLPGETAVGCAVGLAAALSLSGSI